MANNTPLHDQTSAAGAEYVEEAGFLIPGHFGDVTAEYNHARSKAVLVDQSPRGKIEIQGVDAARFLHNLTTNDILKLPPGSGCEAYLTTTKAKVIACLLIYRHAVPVEPAGFSLDTAPGADEKVIAYLDRHLISEQVELSNHTTAFAQMHLAGPQARTVLEAVLGEVPPLEHLVHCVHHDPNGSTLYVRRHAALGLPGYDLVCPANQAAHLWQQLTERGAHPTGLKACEILRIEAGLPREGADIDENTFAPEVGRIAQTISYTKGCYLGQESIVMARDRGQVNRTLVGVRLSERLVPKDSRLFVGDKEVGRITSSVVSPRLGLAIGLAYVRRGQQEPGTHLEVEVNGQRVPVEVIKLPLCLEQ